LFASCFDPTQIKIATDLGIARFHDFAIGFTETKTQAIFGSTPLIEFALDLLAGFPKVDDIAHA
jgi:hypothetical protein